MKEKIMLHDIETEQTLLGCIFSNPIVIEEIPYLQPEHFYRASHQIIFEAMLNVYKRSKRLDETIITDELRKTDKLSDIGNEGNKSYLQILADASFVFGNVDEYGRIILNMWRHRFLANIAQLAAYGAYTEDDTVFEELQKMFRTVETDASSVSTVRDHRSIVDDFLSTMNNKVVGDGGLGISSGFSRLDAVIGRFQPGTLTVVAARTGGGKTAIGLNFIDAALRQRKKDGSGFNVAYLSLEMSDESIASRWLSQNSEINTNKFRNGLLDDTEWERFVDAATELQSVPGTMFTLRPRNNLLPPMRAQLLQLRRDHGIDMIVLDYLQKCKMAEGRDRDEKRIEIEEAVIWCRTIAQELGVPFICLAQLNRESESATRPTMAHIKEASAIEQEADIVLLIQKHVDPNNPNPPNWNATLIVDKNRDGMKTDIKMNYVGAWTKFREGSISADE